MWGIAAGRTSRRRSLTANRSRCRRASLTSAALLAGPAARHALARPPLPAPPRPAAPVATGPHVAPRAPCGGLRRAHGAGDGRAGRRDRCRRGSGSVADRRLRFSVRPAGLQLHPELGLRARVLHRSCASARSPSPGSKRELAQAQLRALKAQLQPHFLFNTLHAITVLIRHDPAAAGRMVVQLSDLLRMTLIDSDRQEATLDAGAPVPPALPGDRADPIPRPAEVRWEIAPGWTTRRCRPCCSSRWSRTRSSTRLATRSGGGRGRHRSEPERRHAGAERDRQRTRLRRARSGARDRGSAFPASAAGWSCSTARRHRFALDRNPDGGA